MKPSADKAIAILEKMQSSCGSAALAYWVLPNVVLTLSGARAYADGVFWSDDKAELEKWNSEISESLKALTEAADVAAVDSGIQPAGQDKQYAGYDIVLGDALQYVLDHTKLLTKKPAFNGDETRPENILKELIKVLGRDDRFKGYSDENIQHVAFGILVGYPDQAITESVRAWDKDDPLAEPMIDANIRGAAYYVCPQPVYSYPRHLAENPDIKAHEKLWSRILEDYYGSDFHKSLEKDPEFKAKMKELGN